MWSRIEFVSGYSSYYTLKGKRIEPKERLAVKFPDGHVQNGKVKIIKHRYEGHGGMSESSSTDELRLVIKFHGLFMELVLERDMEARRL
jgi:hypothetical protein